MKVSQTIPADVEKTIRYCLHEAFGNTVFVSAVKRHGVVVDSFLLLQRQCVPQTSSSARFLLNRLTSCRPESKENLVHMLDRMVRLAAEVQRLAMELPLD